MAQHKDRFHRPVAVIVGFDPTTGEFLGETDPEDEELKRYRCEIPVGGGAPFYVIQEAPQETPDQVGEQPKGPTREDLAGIDQVP